MMKDIFSEWEIHYRELGINPSQICRDGILNENEYKSANPKVLFVLKEVNKFAGGDIRQLLKNGPRSQMWHAVARWSAGILNSFPVYEEINSGTYMKNALKKVAAINLKKCTGRAQSNPSEINAYAFIDRDLLLKQIESIEPDVIIACGIFGILVWLLELEIDLNDLKNGNIVKPQKDEEKDIWVIPFRHPGRVNNSESYEELKELYQQLPATFPHGQKD